MNNKEELEKLLKTMRESGCRIVMATQPPRQSRHYYTYLKVEPICPICIIDHMGLLKPINK
jgi:hypothetical protein